MIAQQHKSLLRFLTCGSIGDSRGTLIGRLLRDTRQIHEDQLLSLYSDSKRHGIQGGKLDLALLVDGLQVERGQGIIVDVACRYFSTEKRKSIIADIPGHERYARSMATGAPTYELAILLIDIRKDIFDQTRHHNFISILSGIGRPVAAINKMDLVGYGEETFIRIRGNYLTSIGRLPGSLDIRSVPLSTLEGDNVTSQNESMSWYSGPTLPEVLGTAEIQRVVDAQPTRLPVQYVNRPNFDLHDYVGTLASGYVEVGQRVKVLPPGMESNVTRIITFDGDREEALTGEATALVLTDEIDISRSDLLLAVDEALSTVRNASVDMVWMAGQPLSPGQSYDIKIAGKKMRVRVNGIRYQADINNLTQYEVESPPLNSIGLVGLTLDEPPALDRYQQNPVTDGLIFIGRLSNVTVGVGMVHEPVSQATAAPFEFSTFELELNVLVHRHFLHRGACDLLGDK